MGTWSIVPGTRIEKKGAIKSAGDARCLVGSTCQGPSTEHLRSYLTTNDSLTVTSYRAIFASRIDAVWCMTSTLVMPLMLSAAFATACARASSKLFGDTPMISMIFIAFVSSLSDM
jgi:hypothetical protein